MRAPSPRIPKNLVTIQATVFTQDVDGGRVLTNTGAPLGPYYCRVHPTSAADRPEHMREEGVEYVTIHFFQQPSAKVRYLINWLDFTPTKVLNVIGPPRTAAGELATWLVECEYRVPAVDPSVGSLLLTTRGHLLLTGGGRLLLA